MFGTFRLTLAMMVVYSHFSADNTAGHVAVFGFYCLSGYLVTRIINTTYADGLGGFGRYLANRALRIYPAYYAAALIAAVAIVAWPDAATKTSVEIPDNLLPSFTIIGLMPRTPILVVPAWSLHVELMHYLLIGALLGRSRFATVGWFAASLAAVVSASFWDFPFDWRYFSPFGSSIAFATGAMIYHFRMYLPAVPVRLATVPAVAVALIGIAMTGEIERAGGLYVSLLLSATAIIALMSLPPRKLDSALGDLAYPVFLLHMPALIIATAALGKDNAPILAGVLTAVLSGLVVILVEQPIKRLRTLIRAKPGPSPRLSALPQRPC